MLAVAAAGTAHAAPAPDFDTPSKSPVPRWAMLRKDEVYARNGPSKDNPKVWTYRVADLPVQIISETKDWCKVSVGGVEGWAPASALWGTQTTAVCTRPDPFAGTPVPAQAPPPVQASAQTSERTVVQPLAMLSPR